MQGNNCCHDIVTHSIHKPKRQVANRSGHVSFLGLHSSDSRRILPAKEGSFVSYPAKESGIKARMVSHKFKDYLTQAQLFYNSLSPIENLHQKSAYSFEFDHCDDPVVYNRMAKHLAEIDLSLSQSVAEKIGARVPEK